VISSLFNASNFMPHGFCINWNPGLLWLYVLSDAVTAVAYFSIPLGLAYFTWHRKDLKYRWIFVLFAGFIVSCGITHILSIVSLWYPIYWLDGLAKAVTAAISAVTALMLIWIIPKALRLPSPAQLEKEVQERREAYTAVFKIQQQLREANQNLEKKINERTRHLERQKALYAALSQCNQAIVYSTNEEELFPQICRYAVQFGGMKMAWIGLVDPTTFTVLPAASFGSGTEYLQPLDISIDNESPYWHEIVGTSIREDQPFWCQDFMNDQTTAQWREHGARFGWNAKASLPLHRNGVVTGAFVLYSGEVNAFDESARDLLVEMAMDISYALDHLDFQAARNRAEETLSKSEAHYRAVAQSAKDAIITADNAGNIIGWNRGAEIIFGYTEAEVMGQPLTVLIPQRYYDRHVSGMHRVLSGGKSHIIGKTVELEGLRKDGSEFPLELSLAKWETAEGQFFTSFIRDITERKRTETTLKQAKDRLLLATLAGGVGVWDLGKR